MSADGRVIYYSVIGVGIGVRYFWNGFKKLRLKRLVENIPTSSIKAAAMGLVEVKGRALPISTIIAPCINKPCVYYRYSVQAACRNGWSIINEGDSSQHPFLLKDETGSAIIFPQGIESDIPWEIVLKTGLIKDYNMSPEAEKFLLSKNVDINGAYLLTSVRVQVKYVLPEQSLYVLGNAMSWDAEEVQQLKQKNWQKELNLLKKNKQELMKYDLDNDGEIDANEWAAAKEKVAKEIDKKFGFDPYGMVLINKGSKGSFFYISSRSEKNVISKLTKHCFIYVFGGPLLSLACLSYILYKLFQ